MSNIYGRDLTGIVEGEKQQVVLICMVDPELSDSIWEKLLPGALI
jgi:hypothetical protein